MSSFRFSESHPMRESTAASYIIRPNPFQRRFVGVPVWGIAALALLPASPAGAALIQLTLNGTISSSNYSLFPNGQAFSISVVYDSVQTQQVISNNQAFYVNTYQSASIVSGSYSSTITGSFGQGVVYDNLASNDGYNGSLQRTSAGYTNTNPKPNPAVFAPLAAGEFIEGAGFALGSSNTSLFSSYAIPTTWNLADYDSTKTFTISTTNHSFGGGISSISAVTVPEPATVASLLVGGVVSLGLRRRARRSA